MGVGAAFHLGRSGQLPPNALACGTLGIFDKTRRMLWTCGTGTLNAFEGLGTLGTLRRREPWCSKQGGPPESQKTLNLSIGQESQNPKLSNAFWFNSGATKCLRTEHLPKAEPCVSLDGLEFWIPSLAVGLIV